MIYGPSFFIDEEKATTMIKENIPTFWDIKKIDPRFSPHRVNFNLRNVSDFDGRGSSNNPVKYFAIAQDGTVTQLVTSPFVRRMPDLIWFFTIGSEKPLPGSETDTTPTIKQQLIDCKAKWLVEYVYYPSQSCNVTQIEPLRERESVFKNIVLFVRGMFS